MRVYFIITMLLSSVLLRAQPAGQPVAGQSPIDSTLAVLRGSKADTGKVRTYVMVSKLYYGTEPRKGFAFADSALVLSQQLAFQRGIAESYNLLGLLTGDTGNNVGARAYFEKSLAINRALGARTAIIANLNNIGRRFSRESDYTKRRRYYFQALALADSFMTMRRPRLSGPTL